MAKKMPLLLKERHGSKGRELRNKRVEITGTASFLASKIALARPKWCCRMKRHLKHWKQAY